MAFATSIEDVTPDLIRIRYLMANLYLQGTQDHWVLIDAGLLGAGSAIHKVVAERFGGAPPTAIIMTHAHFDHTGALRTLLEHWDVPVYAHPLEIPHLTGQADYPSPDPTVGKGALATLSFAYPKGPIDLGERVQPLPLDGSVPGMPGWRWIHTPGHTDGHVSLFREADRCLIVGDAFVTVRQEALTAVLRQKREVHGPPAYFTPDWDASWRSVETLANLRPRIAATGHGTPLRDEALTNGLAALVAGFDRIAIPDHGRYVPDRKENGMGVSLKPVDQQVIVITGASSGIGLAAARTAAGRGATVVLVARTEDALRTSVDEIVAKGGKASYVVADVGVRGDLERVAAATIERHGGFDTWVNDAGVSILGRMDEISDADHRKLFDTNFWGVVYGSMIAADHLRERGGAIINLGSVLSDVAMPMQGMYSVSKQAIKGFTDALRMELEAASAPISVTLIKPSSIDSTYTLNARKYGEQDIKLPPPVYAPQEVAEAIVHAAAHPRRDIYVGGGGRMMSGFANLLPRAMDRISERVLIPLQFRDEPVRNPEGNLWRGQGRARTDGDHPGVVRHPSFYTRASLHPVATRTVMGAGSVLAALGIRRALERRFR